MGVQVTSDPFGGNIPTRKKIVNRIDQELESRGSIFSGRDEKSVLIQKRNIQQQHMREELLRQIEEKKQREEEVKQKKLQEDMKDEFRIQKEMEQQYANENPGFSKTTPKNGLNFNKDNETNELPGFLPELTNRKSEPMKAMEVVDNNLAMNKHSNSVSNNFETTAAFANHAPKDGNNENIQEENGQSSPQRTLNNVITNETNKIKDMIQQVDNKKSLQEQINKRMDIQSSQANAASESPISNKGPVVGNSKIGELSDIVQKLLEEQRQLKSKLNERDEIIADLSKNRESRPKQTQEKERRKNNNKIGSADTKNMAARRLRQKHTHEKEKIQSIENKIQKARKRKADMTKETSMKANQVSGFGSKNAKSRPSSDFNPKLYKSKINNDLDGIEKGRSGKY